MREQRALQVRRYNSQHRSSAQLYEVYLGVVIAPLVVLDMVELG